MSYSVLVLDVLVLVIDIIILADAIQPIILKPPAAYTNSQQQINYGQAVCVDPSGQHVAIGANAYSNYQGLLFLYTLHNRPGQHHHIVLRPHDAQPAEDRSNQLRPHARGSGFGFSCAFPSATSTKQLLKIDPVSVVVVGAPGHDVQRGAVYVYASTNTSDLHASWSLLSKIVAEPIRRSGDLFGWAIAIDADCKTLVVSARGHQANNGHVFIFRCKLACKSCHVETILKPPDYTDTIGPRGIRIRNNFGTSVAVSADGQFVVIGSTGFDNERGAAYVYQHTHSNSTWALYQRLEAPGNKTFSYFGYKVAIDASANVIIVGADGEDHYKGAAYVFRKSSNLFKLQAELRASPPLSEDNFGASVAVSADAAIIAVGAPGTDHNHLTDHGMLYVYQQSMRKRRHGPDWSQIATVKLPHSLSQEGTQFAWDVAINAQANLIVITAPDAPHTSGLAMLYTSHRPKLLNLIDFNWKDEL